MGQLWYPRAERVEPDAMEAARLAGWNPDDGPPPEEHHLPPPVDPALGHNGIPDTDAERTA